MTDSTDSRDTAAYRLLVVEDNPATLRLLELIFEDESHIVDTAQTVDEALNLASERMYDVFVLDINLSERRTGIEVLHEIRKMPRHAGVPAIASTAYALHDHQALFREAGFTSIISKPITRDSLLEGIEHAIQNPSPTPGEAESAYEDIELPPLPTTIPQVLRLVARDDHNETNFEELISVVNRDQVISTWLVRQANSAFFKLSARVDSVEEAIQYMGFRPVCNLLLGKLLTNRFASFETDRETAVYEYVMQLGLGAAHLARTLAQRIDYPHPDIAYSGALLSQMGRLLLLDDRQKQYADLWFDESTFSGPPPIGQETLFLSASYVTMGMEVGRRSNVSDTLLRVIRYHHRPSDVPAEEDELLTFLVAAGLETYGAMMDRPADEVLIALQNSYPLQGTAKLTGTDGSEIIAAAGSALEESRTFADEIFAGNDRAA